MGLLISSLATYYFDVSTSVEQFCVSRWKAAAGSSGWVLGCAPWQGSRCPLQWVRPAAGTQGVQLGLRPGRPASKQRPRCASCAWTAGVWFLRLSTGSRLLASVLHPCLPTELSLCCGCHEIRCQMRYSFMYRRTRFILVPYLMLAVLSFWCRHGPGVLAHPHARARCLLFLLQLLPPINLHLL